MQKQQVEFTEDELRRVEKVGASDELIMIAEEYPTSFVAMELRDHIDRGHIEAIEDAQSHGDSGQRYLVGGGYFKALWNWYRDGATAYSFAKGDDLRILVDLFGQHEEVHIPASIVADVEAGKVIQNE